MKAGDLTVMASNPDPIDFSDHYDMYSPVLANRWDDVVEHLHAAKCPVVHSDDGEGYWVVNSYDAVKGVALDWESFSNGSGFMPDRPADMPYAYPQESDPPLQKQIRKALNPLFNPKAVSVYEPAIRRHAEALVAELKTSAEPEVVRQFAMPLPGRAFCDAVLGMGTENVQYLQDSFDAGILGPVDDRGAAFVDARRILEEHLRQYQADGEGNILLDAILGLEEVDWDVRVGMMMDLTLGGVGTTPFVFASAIHRLATHPEERAKLVGNSELMPGAVEEFIRYYSAAPQLARRVMKPSSVEGVDLSPGECVVLSYGAASRDPRAFDRANELDICRGLPNRHLSFGYGIHHCIGAHFARLDIRVGLEVFLREIPDFSLPPGFTPNYEIGASRVFEKLPIVIGG